MTESTVAIIGSGIVGTTFAYLLAKQGYDVAVFEKGPDYPYPHQEQFQEEVLYLHQNPKYKVPADLKQVTQAGDYQLDLNADFYTLVGGSSTRWSAIALRMISSDFKTKSLYGYGDDWAITYDDVEPYYCKAEALLGVSGTDEDNPFAPPRSQPHPLPAFELTYEDERFAEKLRKHDIVLHTTPQARTRQNYGDRVACDNYGPCHVCPTGSRYSPNYHMQLALKTGKCKLYTNAAVRRINTDRNNQVTSIVYQYTDSNQEQEHVAKIVIVAGNAVESARLLLLSRNEQHPDGLGNQSGLVGKNLTFHHGWHGHLRYAEALYPNRFGGWTGQCHQFLDPPTRGKHGATKIEFPFLEEPSRYQNANDETWKSNIDVLNSLERSMHWRVTRFHSEAIPGPEKFVALSETRDRFGDPFAHVNYELNEMDYATYEFAKGIFEQIAVATEADEYYFVEPKFFTSTAHHHGTCRMGTSADNSVVNAWGEVHGIPNLFMAGGSQFVTPGAVNPTLTMVALAVRTAEYIADQRL